MLTSLLEHDATLRALLSSWHTPWLDAVMWTLGAIGEVGGVWLLAAAVMAAWVPKSRGAAWQVVLALSLSQLVVDGVIKPLVGRPRPFVADHSIQVVGAYLPSTFSFPSGHAALSFSAAVVMAHALPRGRAAWYVLAAAIAFSRIYIGVHYPIDVAVGTLVGLAVGAVVTGGRAWYAEDSAVATRRVPR